MEDSPDLLPLSEGAGGSLGRFGVELGVVGGVWAHTGAVGG